MHGHHPAGVEIEKGAGSVGGAGVYVAELRRVVSADREERQFRRQPSSDLAKAREIRRVSGVIHGVLAAAQHIAAISSMRIFKNPRSPMPRGNVRDVERAVAIRVPPLQLDNLFEAEVRNQVEQMMRNDEGGCSSSLAPG